MADRSKFIRLTKGARRDDLQKCPICGKVADGCSVALDDDGTVSAVTCVRSYKGAEPPGWRWSKDCANISGAVFQREGRRRAGDGEGGSTSGAGGGSAKPRSPAGEWAKLHRKLELAATEERLADLAESLQLSPVSMQALDVGFTTAALELGDARDGWPSGRVPANVPCFPLRSEAAASDKPGRIVGIQYRAGGNKINITGSRASQGLFIPRDLADLPDPVLHVEGHTNVIACHSIGVAAVGRAGACKPVQALARVLHGRRTIVVGDFDPKDSGDWPGKRMAEAIAGDLAVTWNRPVPWAVSPEQAKDLRVWITAALEKHEPAAARRMLLALLDEHSRDATGADRAQPGARELISNVQEQWPEGEKPKRPRLLAIPLPQIREHLHRLTSGWPNRVSGVLFAVEEPKPAGQLPDRDSWHLLDDPAALFAWIQEHYSVRWADARSEPIDPFTNESVTPPGRAEFHASLKMHSGRNFSSVEVLPHHPKMPDSFYLPVDLPAPTGEALAEFVAHFNPDSELDRSLITACLLTMAWGGPCGRRPAFVIQSKHGRGVGKTTTARMLASIWGGAMEVEENEPWEQVRSRLLDESSLNLRVAIIDNIRGRFARSNFEAVVTSPVIDGKRMYVGQFSRPNNVTWILTANTANLSNDIVMRSYGIFIGQAKHAAQHDQWLIPFMRDNRAHVISDCIERLRRGPQCEVEPDLLDRWAPWIHGVLATDPNANDVLRYVHQMRPAMDSDLRFAQEVADVLGAIAARCGFASLETAAFTVRKEHLREWLVLDGVIDTKLSTRAITSILTELATFPPLIGFAESASRGNGRRWLYVGAQGDGNSVVHYELDEGNGPGSPAPHVAVTATAPLNYTSPPSVGGDEITPEEYRQLLSD